jgi:hypothetical protein
MKQTPNINFCLLCETPYGVMAEACVNCMQYSNS